jgi:hypothetical protein
MAHLRAWEVTQRVHLSPQPCLCLSAITMAAAGHAASLVHEVDLQDAAAVHLAMLTIAQVHWYVAAPHHGRQQSVWASRGAATAAPPPCPAHAHRYCRLLLMTVSACTSPSLDQNKASFWLKWQNTLRTGSNCSCHSQTTGAARLVQHAACWAMRLHAALSFVSLQPCAAAARSSGSCVDRAIPLLGSRAAPMPAAAQRLQPGQRWSSLPGAIVWMGWRDCMSSLCFIGLWRLVPASSCTAQSSGPPESSWRLHQCLYGYQPLSAMPVFLMFACPCAGAWQCPVPVLHWSAAWPARGGPGV